jgi:hypothetical protein
MGRILDGGAVDRSIAARNIGWRSRVGSLRTPGGAKQLIFIISPVVDCEAEMWRLGQGGDYLIPLIVHCRIVRKFPSLTGPLVDVGNWRERPK